MKAVRKFFERRVPVSEIKRIRRSYEELLRQRDRQIEELKKDNELLIRNAITQAEKRSEMGGHAKRLIEINRELKGRLAGKKKKR